MTEPSGKVAMTTFQRGDGVLPGEYKVCVSKVEVASAPRPEVNLAIDPSKVSYNEYFKTMSARSMKPNDANVKQIVPEIYRDPVSTPLQCNVPADGNELAFSLVSDSK
jgi:hypothetical protein